MIFFAMFLALIWGSIWAAFLQVHPLGRFLAVKRTWITVVIGVGGDLLIALLVVELKPWLMMLAIIALSSVGIIFRSLHNELSEEWGILNELKNKRAEGSQ